MARKTSPAKRSTGAAPAKAKAKKTPKREAPEAQAEAEASPPPVAADPAALLAGYQARRAAFLLAQRRLDDQVQAQLRRYLAALFREEPGLQVALLGAFQDYDSSQLRGQAYVTDDLEYRWRKVGFEGPCPTNEELQPDVAQRIREELMEFWPSVQRLEGHGWFMAFRRDPAAEGGVSTEKRDFYSDD